MKATQSERRRRRRNRRREKRETAYLTALRHADSSVRAVYPRIVPDPISGKVCYTGNPTGSPDPRKVSVQRAKHKTRFPRPVKLGRHSVVVEKVHVLGDITIAPAWPKLIMAWSQWRNRRKFDIERPRQGNMGNPFEYQHHATPIVTTSITPRQS
jgi:hypothetical protein